MGSSECVAGVGCDAAAGCAIDASGSGGSAGGAAALVPLPPSLLLALIPRASFSTSSYILNIAPMLPSLIPFPMPVPLRVGVECDHYIRTKAISFRRPRVVNSEFDGAKCRLSLFGGLLVLHHSFGNGPKEIPEAFSTALGDVSPAVPSS